MTAPRYLEAKRTIDERSRSRRVRSHLLEALPVTPTIIEIGAGTGTLVSQLLEWGLTAGTYRGVDTDKQAVAFANDVRPRALRHAGYQVHPTATGFEAVDLQIQFETGTVPAVLDTLPTADLLIAQQFMDLVALDEVLDPLLETVRPGGLAYFPLTFDGETIFQPDHRADDTVVQAYHRSMDRRPGGDSRAGRHLLDALGQRPGTLMAVSASDAIVRPIADRYPADEAFVLGQLLDFIEQSVPDSDVPGISEWLMTRRAQLRNAELSYVGHRYDLLYRRPDSN